METTSLFSNLINKLINGNLSEFRRVALSRSNWYLGMLVLMEYLEKNPRSRDDNQQQTQPTYHIKPEIEPRPHWWEASALTTAPSVLPRGKEIHELAFHRVLELYERESRNYGLFVVYTLNSGSMLLLALWNILCNLSQTQRDLRVDSVQKSG